MPDNPAALLDAIRDWQRKQRWGALPHQDTTVLLLDALLPALEKRLLDAADIPSGDFPDDPLLIRHADAISDLTLIATHLGVQETQQ